MAKKMNRFIDSGFRVVTVEEARDTQKKVSKEQQAAREHFGKEQEAAATRALVESLPVEVSGDIWLL